MHNDRFYDSSDFIGVDEIGGALAREGEKKLFRAYSDFFVVPDGRRLI